MYISKLEIHNYRNFSDFSVKLKPLTLIIGENNAGKSNLLDSIGLILGQEISFFKKRMLETGDFNHECIVILKRQILDQTIAKEDIKYPEIRVTVTLTGWTKDQEAVICDWFIGQDYSEATLTYLFAPDARFKKNEEIQAQRDFIQSYQQKIGKEAFDKINENDKLDLINFPISKYYYILFGGSQRESQANSYHLNQLKFELLDALRDAKTELVASHSNRLLFRILNTKDDLEYQNLKTQLIGLQQAVDTNPALQAIKESITAQLDKISLSSDFDNLVDFTFSMPNVEDILRKISIIYGDNPIKIERNGTGRNNLLFISLVLSYIEDATKINQSYFRVIGIEEPESHLHANLQDHLAANIEQLIMHHEGKEYRKDIQLLLTSHSTHVSTKMSFENTVVLYRDRKETKAHYIFDGFPKTAEGFRNQKYLNKYLDAVNTNLFYSRRAILVEGISEKLLIPHFFKILKNASLEKSSCCVINVNGLAFKHFLEIIKNGYFIKCIALTDRDTGTDTEDRGENLATKYKGEQSIRIGISAESTFEKDVISANSKGKGKALLLNALKIARPNAGPAYEKTLVGDIVTNDFFALIEGYKSDFSYALSIMLEEESTGFNVPKYIAEAIEFVIQ